MLLRLQRGVRILQILCVTSYSSSNVQTFEVNPVGPPKVDLFVDTMSCIASMMDYFLSINKFNSDNSTLHSLLLDYSDTCTQLGCSNSCCLSSWSRSNDHKVVTVVRNVRKSGL